LDDKNHRVEHIIQTNNILQYPLSLVFYQILYIMYYIILYAQQNQESQERIQDLYLRGEAGLAPKARHYRECPSPEIFFSIFGSLIVYFGALIIVFRTGWL